MTNALKRALDSMFKEDLRKLKGVDEVLELNEKAESLPAHPSRIHIGKNVRFSDRDNSALDKESPNQITDSYG